MQSPVGLRGLGLFQRTESLELSLPRPVKSITVVVDHVSWISSDPYFSFPTDAGCPFGKRPEAFEGADVNRANGAFRDQFLECKMP